MKKKKKIEVEPELIWLLSSSTALAFPPWLGNSWEGFWTIWLGIMDKMDLKIRIFLSRSSFRFPAFWHFSTILIPSTISEAICNTAIGIVRYGPCVCVRERERERIHKSENKFYQLMMKKSKGRLTHARHASRRITLRHAPSRRTLSHNRFTSRFITLFQCVAKLR
jgi:hypothetical protein